MDFDVNYLAILIATIGGMVIGWAWYGPLFGKQWAHMMGMNMDDPAFKEQAKKEMKPAMIVTFVSFLIMAFMLAQGIKILNITTVSGGLQTSFYPWLGYVLTTVAIGNVWGGKDRRLIAIDAGHILAVMMVMGVILTLMQ